MWQKRLQKILVVVGIVSFVGSTAVGTFGMFTSGLNPPKQDAKTAATQSQDSQMQARARGYELVLKREPENQIALQGLVETRLQMKDFKGAVAPMEKLVKRNPGKAEYKALLAEVKQRAGK
jgi:cytochrome c-type biogenesis protein CcmH/NrfG